MRNFHLQLGVFVSIAGAILFCCLPCRAQSLPDLPPVALATLGPAIREQVQNAYEQARVNPQDAVAQGRLGMVLQTYQQDQSAAICYERARKLAPADFGWAYYLGTVQGALGNHSAAVLTFKDAVRLKPDYIPAQLRLAESLLASGELQESRKLYKSVVERQPDSSIAHYGLGRVMTALGETAAAIVSYRRACELYPGFGSAHYALGLAYRDAGELVKAKEHLSLSQTHKLGRPPANDPLLDAVAALNVGAAEHIKRGVSLEANGRLQESIAEHERALEINPGIAQAHVNLISLYGRVGQVEKAEQHYRQSIALNPGLADSHYNFGVLLTEQGKFREAAQAFQRSLDINPNYAEAHMNYGSMQEREGRLDLAEQHYRRAIENKAGYRLARFHLGRILVHGGKLAEAIEHFHQTLTPEDADTPRFMFALAAAYARAGDRQRAIQYAREAKQRAESYGQTELAGIIERDLRNLEKNVP